MKNAENAESTRAIRFLLINGARTDIRDRMDKLPIDYVEDISSQRLQ